MSEPITRYVHRPETSAELLAMDHMLTLSSDIAEGLAAETDTVSEVLRASTEQGIHMVTAQSYLRAARAIVRAETTEDE